MKKCLLLDFDGVISRNSTADIMNATYAFISEFKDINRLLFDELFKALVPFPLFESVNFFMFFLLLLLFFQNFYLITEFFNKFQSSKL